jgi:hypothetical protein
MFQNRDAASRTITMCTHNTQCTKVIDVHDENRTWSTERRAYTNGTEHALRALGVVMYFSFHVHLNYRLHFLITDQESSTQDQIWDQMKQKKS